MRSWSFWEQESFFGPRDVLIVGGGLVGLWSAYYLKRKNPRLSLAIVDRGIFPDGASTRNAGFACFGSFTELMADSLKSGEDRMLELVEMRYRGLQRIRKAFHDQDLDYCECGGFELLAETKEDDINILRSQIDRMNQALKKIIRSEKIFRLQDSKISEFRFSGVKHLIENKLEGQLHPGKLVQALQANLQAQGVHFLPGTEITGYQVTNGQVELDAPHNIRLRANRILICTNAYARALVPELDVEPARGQVLVTSALDDLPFRGTFHYQEGFYYFRDLGKRVLLGGARNLAPNDEKSFELQTTDKIQGELERFLRETVLPGEQYTIEHRWSGIMGMGQEKMPIIRRLREEVYCAVRLGGMGVALAPEVGKKMAALLS
jgi:glycine/D-amino acid oxidase-like deaminating enzyme